MKEQKENVAGKKSNGWYVIYTQSKHEKVVFEELILQKYNAYLPVVEETSVWSDRKKRLKNLFSHRMYLYI
jgi:hypothetical protein